MRAATLSLLVPFSTLLLLACEPGTGGGGGGICFQDPDYPGCSPGGSDTTGGDTSVTQPDTVSGDDVPITQPDAEAPDDTTNNPDPGVEQDGTVNPPDEDTVTPPDTTADCGLVGATRCAEAGGQIVVETCDGTGWTATEVCTSGVCSDGVCQGECAPDCSGMECGADGCGGDCGTCPGGFTCVEGLCVEEECVPDCSGLECGPDGCGGDCGLCPPGWACAEGLCEETCTPDCAGMECGGDGCGGDCGTCLGDESCQSGQCVPDCTPSCLGKDCGGDGCGGTCGTCGAGETCASGTCEGGTTTGLDCPGILECVNGCSDEACAQACVEDGSSTGQSEFLALNQCFADNGCEDSLCAAENCAYQNAECNFDQAGTGSCSGIVECQQGCTTGDSECVYGCYHQASVSAQASLIALNQCIGHYCPQGGDTCVEGAVQDPEQCGTFASACFGG
ncbi:MAG: hypothetical protein ACQEXJ_01420 [Myxococcota bacterium]